MKFFAFIMSFYLLALSCYPCGDRGDHNVKAEQKISAASQHQHPQDTDGACTPFCSCSHCPASAFFQPFMNVKTHPLFFQERRVHYGSDDFHSYNFHTIWQPPKII